MCDTASTLATRTRVNLFLSAPCAGHAFVVFGNSGSGKTFLMSKVVVEAGAAVSKVEAGAAVSKVEAGAAVSKGVCAGPKGCVCVRFLGTSAASSAV